MNSDSLARNGPSNLELGKGAILLGAATYYEMALNLFQWGTLYIVICWI